MNEPEDVIADLESDDDDTDTSWADDLPDAQEFDDDDAVEATFLDRRVVTRGAEFDPSQPRVPAGQPEGGQWTSDPATGLTKVDTAKVAALVDQALQSADFSEIDNPKSFEDLSPAQQDATEQEWIDDALQGDTPEWIYEEADRWVDDQIDSDEVLTDAKKEFLDRISGTDHLLHDIDPDTVDEAMFDPSDPEKSSSDLRLKNGEKLSEAQAKQASTMIDRAYSEAMDSAREHLRESDTYYELVSQAESQSAKEEWGNLSDSEKFEAAGRFGHTEGVTLGRGLPTEWKWEKDGEDYDRTRVMARELTNLRAQQLMTERGLTDAGVGPGEIAEDVWGAWKSSSTSEMALALQEAASRELGSVSRLSPNERASTLDTAALFAPNPMSVDAAERGMARLQAYVRAEYETTQFVLEKAGVDRVQAYRSVIFDNQKFHERTVPSEEFHGYLQLPDLALMRNSLSSTTSKLSVANNWNGTAVAYVPGSTTRVVLRFDVPRQAVFSLPVFGQNVTEEQEIVMLGAKRGVKWDAWSGKAPTPVQISIKDQPVVTKKAAAAKKPPLVIDLFEQDKAGGHWLRKDRRKMRDVADAMKVRRTEPTPKRPKR